MLRKIVILFFFVFVSVSILAQPVIEVTSFSDRDGLDRNKVTGIIKDRRGFIWVSSWGGLYRYDGYCFNPYKIKPGDGNELVGCRLDAVKEDVKGNLWCRSYDRLYYFDTENERFKDITALIERKEKKSCVLDKYFVLDNGYTWLKLNNNVCFRINQNYLSDIRKFTFKGNADINRIEADNNGDTWVLTKKGSFLVGKNIIQMKHLDLFSKFGKEDLFLASKDGYLVRYHLHSHKSFLISSVKNVTIKSMFSDERKWVAVCTSHGVFSIKNDKAIKISSETEVEQVYRSRSGDYWISTKDASVYKISPNGKTEHLRVPFTTLDRKNHSKAMYETCGWMVIVKDGHLMYYDVRTHTLLPFYMGDGSIYTAVAGKDFIDVSGLLWVGVDNNMFERIRIYNRQYEKINPEDNILSQFRDSKGLIWQALDNSAVRVMDDFGCITGYLNRKGDIIKNKVTFARVYDFAEDHCGNMFLASRGEGLFCLKRKAKGFSVAHFNKRKTNRLDLNDNNIYSLYIDHKGRLWVGTYEGGLNLMIKKSDGTVIFRNKSNGLKNFPPCDRMHCIRSMTEIDGKAMLVGTSSGVYSFSSDFVTPENIHFYHSGRKSNDIRSLASNEVMNVFDIPHYGVFVTTSFSGLCLLQSKNILSDNLRFKTWGTQLDAPSDEPRSVFTDRNNRLWVVFKNAVSLFNPQTMISEDFTLGRRHDDGCYTTALPVTSARGMIFLGTENGTVSFNPMMLRKNTQKSPIMVTDVRVFDRSIPYLLNSDTIRLKSGQRDFVLEFAALELGGSDNVEYKYMLEGRDKTWIRNGRNRTLHFFNLGADTYSLLIKSTNNDRVWTDNVKHIIIIVEPTFWETGWAMALYVIFALVIIVVIVGIIFYIYRLRMNMSFEKRMVDMKLKYFTDISHDLRTPLTLIDGPVTELLEEDHLSDKAHSYLSIVHRNSQRMLTLINQILDFRKIQNEKMKLLISKIDLIKELRSIMSNFDYISQENKIDFKLHTKDDKPVYVWVDCDKFDKIFFNLLSNAFKYTRKGNCIWVEVASDNSCVSVSVCDTGIGMPMYITEKLFERFETILTDNCNVPSSGIGLSLVKELVDMHHARLEVDSKEGQGSRLTVVFRQGSEHFMQDDKTEFLTEDNSVTKVEHELTLRNIEEDEQMSILIVEDNLEMLNFLRDILKSHFYIITATNGQEGVNQAREQMPNLIISDICMPVMDGWMLVRILRSDVNTSHIPIVLLTAMSSIDDRIEGAKLGVEDYIVKPFSPTYLKVRVSTILQKQHERQNIYSKQFFEEQTLHLIPLPQNNSGIQLRMERNDADMMLKLKVFMEENLAKEIVINDMADYVGLSRTVFYNKIKTITGLSPIDFSRKYRVERAAQMMRGEGMSVSEACYNTGFSDPKYFSRIFKKFFGIAPSEYRKGKQ